jgi:ATP-dependent exoDNAse (exonuclease V) alpha subunit
VCVKNCKELEIYNNESLKVVRWSKESIEFKPDDKHKCIATKDFAELMRPAYAITGHCSQGSTFDCKYRYAIYDWVCIPKDVRSL